MLANSSGTVGGADIKMTIFCTPNEHVGPPLSLMASTDDESAVYLSWLPSGKLDVPEHYEVRREGVTQALVLGTVLSYNDFDAPAGGPLPPGGTSATLSLTDGILLTWQAATIGPGAQSVYDVVAVYSDTPTTEPVASQVRSCSLTERSCRANLTLLVCMRHTF